MASITKFECKRCNHSWFPRSENVPRYCPKCNSPYWNQERRNTGLRTITNISCNENDILDANEEIMSLLHERRLTKKRPYINTRKLVDIIVGNRRNFREQKKFVLNQAIYHMIHLDTVFVRKNGYETWIAFKTLDERHKLDPLHKNQLPF
jgi:hypothetical protein